MPPLQGLSLRDKPQALPQPITTPTRCQRHLPKQLKSRSSRYHVRDDSIDIVCLCITISITPIFVNCLYLVWLMLAHFLVSSWIMKVLLQVENLMLDHTKWCTTLKFKHRLNMERICDVCTINITLYNGVYEIKQLLLDFFLFIRLSFLLCFMYILNAFIPFQTNHYSWTKVEHSCFIRMVVS